jgi:hypothetical protein
MTRHMAGLRPGTGHGIPVAREAAIRACCFNRHSDVAVMCLSRRGLEAAVVRCAKAVSSLSQKTLQGSEGTGAGSCPCFWTRCRLVCGQVGNSTRAVLAFGRCEAGARVHVGRVRVMHSRGARRKVDERLVGRAGQSSHEEQSRRHAHGEGQRVRALVVIIDGRSW